MKKTIFMALVAATFTFAGASAQEESNGKDRAEMMKEMISKQADRLAEDLKLDDSKAEAFKKTYTEYRTKEMELRFGGAAKAKQAKGQKSEKSKRPEITDAKADSIMTASFARQESELKLKQEYYAKLKSEVGAAAAMKALMPRQQMNRGGQGGGQGGQRGGFGGQRGGFGGGQQGGFGGPGNMDGGF